MAATARKTGAPDLDDPALYVNRELGLLSFQWRVLEEALISKEAPIAVTAR